MAEVRRLRLRLPLHAACPPGQATRTPIDSITAFDAEFRSHFGYNQPATPLSAMGVIAAATGDTASKYVARRETPLYIPENCTQCMECISVCPDTALPNCSQDLSTILSTAVTRYVADPAERSKMLAKLPEIEKLTRQRMLAEIKDRNAAADDHPRSHRVASTASRPRPRRSSSPSSTRFRWPTRR